MSRYVDKPHGLTLGSGNHFFVIDRHHADGEEKIRDGYKAIVSIRKYDFTSCSTANVFIETPAEQLIWRRKQREIWKTYGDITFPIHETYFVLSKWIAAWLTKEVGPMKDRWDTYTQAEMSSRCIFFKRRMDALAFCKMIDGVLAGVKIGKW
jgi:hypothetical protein